MVQWSTENAKVCEEMQKYVYNNCTLPYRTHFDQIFVFHILGSIVENGLQCKFAYSYCTYTVSTITKNFWTYVAVNGCQLEKNHFSTLAYSKSDDHKLLTRNSRCNRRRPLACHYRKCFEVGQIFILLLLNYCSEYLVSQYFMLFNDGTPVSAMCA